jgi:hypothetical protein
LPHSKLPILTLNEVCVSGVQQACLYLRYLYVFLHHFVTFFSIFLLFFLFFYLSETFCRFFFFFFSFFKPPPPFSAQNQGGLKTPHTKPPPFLTQNQAPLKTAHTKKVASYPIYQPGQFPYHQLRPQAPILSISNLLNVVFCNSGVLFTSGFMLR